MSTGDEAVKDAPCWICGEPSFCMGGKAGLPKMLVCEECFAVTNGELSVKRLREENAALAKWKQNVVSWWKGHHDAAIVAALEEAMKEAKP